MIKYDNNNNNLFESHESNSCCVCNVIYNISVELYIYIYNIQHYIAHTIFILFCIFAEQYLAKQTRSPCVMIMIQNVYTHTHTHTYKYLFRD